MNSFLSFAIDALIRRWRKNLFVLVVLTFLISMVLSVFTTSGALKKELLLTLEDLPDITVQKISGGKQRDIEAERADLILEIPGVENVFSRVWGYYHFDFAGTNFSIVGMDVFEPQYKPSLEKATDLLDEALSENENSMILGAAVHRLFTEIGYDKTAYFKKTDGNYLKLEIAGVFKTVSELESADTIIIPLDKAKELLSVPENFVTDFAVKVANPSEVRTIVIKILEMFPDVRIITRDDMRVSYQNIFDYKNGIFLAVLIIALFTFFMIILDRLSGVSSEEKKEVGILKALGWEIIDVIKIKFYESALIAFVSYLLGMWISMVFVYGFDAPGLREIYSGFSVLKAQFQLPFHFDWPLNILVFLVTVPVYIAATIVPSWKIAVQDADEVMR